MLCRICFSETNSSNFLNISENQEIQNLILKHLNVELKLGNSIEKQIICVDCTLKLKEFHKFYIKVEEIQLLFQNDVSSIIKTEHVDVHIESENNVSHLFGQKKSSEQCSLVNKIEKLDNDDIECEISKTKEQEQDQKQQNDDADDKKCEPSKTTTVKKKIKIKILKRKKKNSEKLIDDGNNKIIKKPANKIKTNEIDGNILDFMNLDCNICEFVAKTFAELKNHYRALHNEEGYAICCQRKYFRRVYLVDHIKTHINPEIFKCQICNKVQANHNSLQSHIKTSHELKYSVKCEICSKVVSNNSALELHKYTHIPIEERNHKCANCGKTFASPHQMKIHFQKVHTSFAKNVCHVCGKVIKDVKLFIKHQEEHQGIIEPKAQCEKCGVWLKNVTSLRKHTRYIHDGEGSKQICPICKKECPSRAALKSHKYYVHTKANVSFACSICNKEFKKPITLKEHMSSHTGEQLYTCPHCPKTFASNANMHHHRKKIHRKEWEEKRAAKMKAPTDSSVAIC